MRIGVVAEAFEGGGAERQAAIWVHLLAEQGHDVTAVTLRPTDHPLEDSHLRVICLPKSRSTDFIPIVRRLRRLEHELDAIIAFEPYLALYCALANLRIPWMAVTGKVPYTLPDDSRIPMAAFRMAFRRATLAVAPSRGAVDCHRRMGIRRNGTWRVIPNIADAAAFTEPTAERKDVLFVGRLVPVKNPLLAVESAAVAGAPLTILGEGELEQAIEERARANSGGPPVTLLPYVSSPWSTYARHRVLVVTSNVESFGNVLVESLAAGTPVVSLDCDFGPREILAGSRFSHLTDSTPEAIGKALRTVLSRPHSDEEAAECREIASRYRVGEVFPLISDALLALSPGGGGAATSPPTPEDPAAPFNRSS